MLKTISGQEALRLSVNPYGTKTITPSDGVVTGDFWAIAFETDTTIATLELADNSTGAAALIAVAPHGAALTKIWQITSISLSAGTATLYKAAPES